ncbi:FAD-dependent oxidoreductase [Occultella glacieicola]|uniref:FAD-dependent oxidoreductase n=1 Tax=Occultella glacieicola TaxID=2518684 RepID=A0ABY2E0U1_9MICO|nr:FAD-dependent oxidoreductase [Occultella glacieicola]TDE91569.1 FAD-dependent oxidoreductase [Occultella glacieicola]
MAHPRVVVVGGGYGGVAVAQQLDAVADVMLIEPKDAFVHAVGTLRAVVDPAWEDRVFLPYDRLLSRGRVIHDSARAVGANRVSFTRTEFVDADYLVLATGTAYPFPAKFLESDAWVVRSRMARLREAIGQAERVLLVGAGPVGVELAGELTSAFGDLGVTLVDRADDILTTIDVIPQVRDSIRTQLIDRGVDLVLGAPLGFLPPMDVGRLHDFTVRTDAGVEINAQVWFRCYGNRAVTDYVTGGLLDARRPDGTLSVTEHLSVAGHDTVFAVGDVADLRETKRADAARAHGRVVATNIADLIAGRSPSAVYVPPPERIVIPLGPDGGASQLLDTSGVPRFHGPEETSRMKGVDLFTDLMAEQFHRLDDVTEHSRGEDTSLEYAG